MGVQRNTMKSRYGHNASGQQSKISCGVSALTDDSEDLAYLSDELRQQAAHQVSKSVDHQAPQAQQQNEQNQLMLYNQMLQNLRRLQRAGTRQRVIIRREINQGFSLKNLERILHKSFKLSRQRKDQETQTGSPEEKEREDDRPLIGAELESMLGRKTFVHSNEQLSNRWRKRKMQLSKRHSESFTKSQKTTLMR